MWRLVLLVAVVALLVAVKLLPWWGTVALFVGLFVAWKVLGKKLLEAAFTAPFKAKGRVLRGATAEVHSVTPAEPPPPGDVLPEEAAEGPPVGTESPRRWFAIDVTVRPDPAAARPGGFTSWEPGELQLVRPDAGDPGDDEEDDDVALVTQLEIQQDGTFVADDGVKLPGPQRLRMLAGVQPGVARLKFRYYFESFGEVNVP